MRIPIVLFFLATSVSLACAQPASRAKPQASLDRGVTASADAIHQLDRVIAKNEEDLSKLFAQQGFKFMKAAGGEGLDWIKPLESGYTGFQAGKDLNAGRYAEALSEAAKIIADVWGELDPNVKLGKAGVDVAADVYEAQSLLRQQAQLLALRLDLEKQYYKLKGRSGLDLGQADKIQRALDQDAQLHQKFLESLKKYNLNQQDVTSKALKNASVRPGQGYQVGSGMIVDPQKDVDALAKIPGINPDFIDSLRKQFALLEKGDLESVYTAATLDKYDNTDPTSYISVFGPARSANAESSADAEISPLVTPKVCDKQLATCIASCPQITERVCDVFGCDNVTRTDNFCTYECSVQHWSCCEVTYARCEGKVGSPGCKSYCSETHPYKPTQR